MFDNYYMKWRIAHLIATTVGLILCQITLLTWFFIGDGENILSAFSGLFGSLVSNLFEAIVAIIGQILLASLLMIIPACIIFLVSRYLGRTTLFDYAIFGGAIPVIIGGLVGLYLNVWSSLSNALGWFGFIGSFMPACAIAGLTFRAVLGRKI